ncbi:hypothetical protein CUR40_00125 [Latilactobacillus sakei]|uniref:hypothetical protein n=1 Tax=Latilactobacillus sakei TaxID=1599 RepID=UPI00033D2649|nr:hypothetical protein [Latilactobacillus sakei]EOR85810.1 cell surface protein [Latilactobacillus sakei subsp. sakei LS25]MCB4409145.1 hypothetical protein [Latilactobacillus sakei]PKX63650.1 hypothetical protein CUR38_03125 [Latilactobacillus sakei]PKX69106.1 hypothetical protein CUR40_00125 [Latilactobacillus sakei]
MKSGKQILALTILSLGVYRFSQTFLMQQVQKVSAADTAVGKENSDALTGNELNITVKNYPTKVIESSSDSQSSSSSAQTEQPVSKTQPDQQTTNQSTTTAQQVPAAQQDQSKTANTQEVAEQQRAAQKATNASDKSTAAQSVAQTTQDQAKAAEATTANTAKNTHKIAKKTIKKHAKASSQGNGNQQGQDNANQDQQQADFLKHHAQVEKDIAMFQQSMSPNTPSGGATTQVGAVFGALAGQGVYAVQNEIE